MAVGDYSHAEGQETYARHKSQHVFGEYNVWDLGESETYERGEFVEIVGNGDSELSTSNARALDWDGNEYLAGDIRVNCNNDSGGGTALGAAVTALKLQVDIIPDTTQTITYDSSGNVSAIVHTDENDDIVRTDTFTFGENTITETRTLDTGEVLTIVTNTSTLVTTITYTEAA